jgi:hypothetical protein
VADQLGNASDDLIGALIGTQAEYAAVIGPIIRAVRQAAEMAETLPVSREKAGLELLQQFGAQVVLKARDRDLLAIHDACDDFVTRFRKLAGN